MQIDEIIKLFEALESGNENISLGFHLHTGISNALDRYRWVTNQRYKPTFSGFLTALRDTELPEGITDNAN